MDAWVYGHRWIMLIMLTIGTLTKLALVFVGKKEDQMKCVFCLYLTAVVVVVMMVTSSLKWLWHVVFLTALPSCIAGRWMGSSSGSSICRAGCWSPLIVAILWRTTHATIISQALSGFTLRWHRNRKRAFSRPLVIFTRALVLQWAQLKFCWGPVSGSR